MSVEQPRPTGDDRTVARLFGALLMVVGGLIAVLSGLCSLGLVVMMVAHPGPGAAEVVSAMGVVAIFGGIPLAVGGGVFLVGRSLWRGPKAADPRTFD